MHDLHVVNIEEHLHALRSHQPTNLHRAVDVVAEIIRVPLHLFAHLRVQHLETQRHFFLLRVTGDFLQPLDHILGADFIGNSTAETGKRNHRGKPRRRRGVDPLPQHLEAFRVFLHVRKALREAVAARQRTHEAMLLEQRKIIRGGQFYRGQTQPHCDHAQFCQRHRLEAPGHHRLPHLPVFRAVHFTLSRPPGHPSRSQAHCSQRRHPAQDLSTGQRSFWTGHLRGRFHPDHSTPKPLSNSSLPHVAKKIPLTAHFSAS